MTKHLNIIGLTGGIASGKSSVMNLFAKKNIPVVDADEIARQVVLPDSAGLMQIVNHFGAKILTEKGALNRVLLREIIFNDEAERLWLNALLHPLIEAETFSLFQHYQDAPYLIWAVPLLIETQLHKKVDRILLVDCAESLQLERLIKRDKIDKELAKKIIQSQLSHSERLKYADDVIYNHGNFDNLKQQVEQLDHKYRSLQNHSLLK